MMKKLADGSNDNHRLDSASVRAVDAYMKVVSKAQRLSDALDEITLPGVRANASFDQEDSLVVAIQDVPRRKL